MESAGKEDTPEDAERKGLGTTATRAGIIEKLISAGFAAVSYTHLEGTCWLNIADTYCGTGSKADHQDPKYPKGRKIGRASCRERV